MMKPILTLLCMSVLMLAHAQQIAITETGEEVILYDDGTWQYQNAQEEEVVTEVPLNPKVFTKDENATFLLKSKKVNLGFWLDPKKWSFKKGSMNGEAEYELQLREGDLYGMIIAEKVEIPIGVLRSIALENGRNVAPDLKIVHEEYRMVNGMKVLMLQMDGTLQGIKFSYYGYYYSNSSGTVQFITYTSQSLLDDYIETIEQLLNGFISIE